MKAGAPFARVGAFPTKDAAQLATALALADQRAHDKFAALDAVDGDVIGTWKSFNNGFNGGTLGNGRLVSHFRVIAGVNAGYRFYLEVGATTTIGPFGFGVTAPPLFEFDTDKFPRVTGNPFAIVPASYAGIIGGLLKGGVVPALLLDTGEAAVLGSSAVALAANDVVTVEVEFPIRKARS